MPHQPILPLEPFRKWGLDFVGPFKPSATCTRNKYIIVAIDYCTKWVEVKTFHDNTAEKITKFVYEYLRCRFGCPIELASDQGGHFVNWLIRELTFHYTVVHKKSTPYYPQANGLTKSTNKTLQTILKKIVNEHRIDWDDKLHNALWAYRTTFKTSIGSTSFWMAFGLEAVMPIVFQVPSVRVQLVERLSESDSKQQRLEQLLELGEERIASFAHLEHGQQRFRSLIRTKARSNSAHWLEKH